MRSAPSADADGNLPLTAEGARQQQVRDVGARNQQDQADRADQDDERAPDVADDLFLERDDAERQAAVGRIVLGMLAPQPGGERVHLRLRLLEHDTALQLAQDVEVFAAADGRRVRSERQRDR